jgi:hypothetical protein
MSLFQDIFGGGGGGGSNGSSGNPFEQIFGKSGGSSTSGSGTSSATGTSTTANQYAPAGLAASDQLLSLLGIGGSGGAAGLDAYKNTIGYQQQLNEGLNQLGSGLAARGLGLSGQGIKAGTQFAQGLAASTANDYASQLMNIMGLGQSQTTNTSSNSTWDSSSKTKASSGGVINAIKSIF